MADNRKWCWRIVDDRIAKGPFESKEEALRDAYEYDDPPPDKISVGRCQFGVASSYAPCAFDIIERIEEVAYDSGDILEVADGAEEAFNKLIKKWADKYLSCSIWYCDSETEMHLVEKESSHHDYKEV